MNKRIFGFLSWQFQRRSENTDQVLAAVTHDIEQQSVDHVVVTGDLTHVGLPADFAAAQGFLQELGPSSRVTVIPGNHDRLVHTDWQRTWAPVADYMVSDDARPSPPPAFDPFPLLRICGEVAVIGLSSARPSPPLLATGTTGKRQLAQLGRILQQTGDQGLFRIILIHHPPVPGAVAWRKRLTDLTAFGAVVSNHGAELILHGHTHKSSLNQLTARAGPIPVIGAPSVTLSGRYGRGEARYHLYCLKEHAGGWLILVTGRCLSPSRGHWVSHSLGELQIPRSDQQTRRPKTASKHRR